STERRLVAIGYALPDHADFLSAVLDALDAPGARRRRIERRDAAIIEAAGLLRQTSPSGTAKAIDDALRRFVGSAWPRERDLAEPPTTASALRAALWRIARE